MDMSPDAPVPPIIVETDDPLLVVFPSAAAAEADLEVNDVDCVASAYDALARRLRFRISVDTSHSLLGIIPWRREKVMVTLDPDEAADAEALRSLLLRYLPDIPETQGAVPLPTRVAEAARRFSRE